LLLSSPQIENKFPPINFPSPLPGLIVENPEGKLISEFNKKFLGRVLEVLIDEKQKDVYLGRSQYDAPEVDGSVYVKSKKKLKPGDFVRVKIIDTLEYDLIGEVHNEHC